jgi:hypothetical protein
MKDFLESFFGASWRTSLFACIAVAFTALASCNLSPTIDKIAVAGAAVSTAIGLFLARDNKVTSSQVQNGGASRLKLILFLLIPAMFFGGCHNITATPAATQHITTTYNSVVRYCGECDNGEAGSCQVALTQAASEFKYIADPNNGVDMEDDYAQQVRITGYALRGLCDKCLEGDPVACKEGTRISKRGLKAVLDGINNTTSAGE